MTSSIINFLIAYGMCQAFFIAFIILKSNRTLFKSLFAALLIIEGVTLFERLLVETQLINTLPHILGVSHPISFLKPPLILFMTYAITIPHFKLSSKKYWHFIGFGIMLILNIPFYFLSGTEKLETVNTFMNKVPSYASFDFYFTLSFFLYIGIYIYLSLKKIAKFKNQITNNTLVNWINNVLKAYCLFLILHLVYFMFQPIGQYNFALINQLSMLAMTFIIQSIAFKIVNQSSVFNNKLPKFTDLQNREQDENTIIHKLEKDKVFLNDNLNLASFSKSISLSPKYVSEIINQKFNCSFKQLINQYRLEEAKHKIIENKDSNIKLIDIAYESGFNNKVSFYRIFKQYEGISPSIYLEKIKNVKK